MKEIDLELRRLYSAAREHERPSLQDRRAVRAAVLAAAATAAVNTTAVAGSLTAQAATAVPAITAGKVLAWISVGVALGAATTGAVVAVQSTSTEQRSHLVQDDASHAASRKPLASRRSSRPFDEAPTAPASPKNALSAPVLNERAQVIDGPRRNSRRLVEPAAAASARVRLGEETRGLAEVQGALSRGEPQRALELLTAQERRFHDGALSEERAAARVVALCAAGALNEAELARKLFLARYPRSPLAQRVLRSCGE